MTCGLFALLLYPKSKKVKVKLVNGVFRLFFSYRKHIKRSQGKMAYMVKA